MSSFPAKEGWDVAPILPESWSFAATTESIAGLRSALDHSLHIEGERKFNMEGEAVERMKAASKALADVLSTGLWGSGPFTVSVSGNGKSLYLAVTAR